MDPSPRRHRSELRLCIATSSFTAAADASLPWPSFDDAARRHREAAPVSRAQVMMSQVAVPPP